MAQELVTYEKFDLYAKSETTADAAIKVEALDAAHIATWDALGRRVVVASTATARVFRPSGGDVLWLDDFTTLTSLVENGVTLTSGTDFVLEPLNQLSASGVTVPYDRAVRYGTDWYCDYPKATVTVTAAWGWTAIPAPIVEMCKVVGKAYLQTRDFTQGIVVLTDMGAFGARETKLVRDTISKYRSHKTWGVA